MPYEIILHDEDGYLEVRHHGELKPDEAYSSRTEAGKLMKDRGLVRVLVDLCDAEVAASTVEVFSFHETEPKALPKGTQFALVSSPSAWSPQMIAFAESVAVTRGLDKRSFASREDALSWLLDSGDVGEN